MVSQSGGFGYAVMTLASKQEGIRHRHVVTTGNEIGIEGIVAKAYDSAGALVGTATTLADGTYTLNVSVIPGQNHTIDVVFTNDAVVVLDQRQR